MWGYLPFNTTPKAGPTKTKGRPMASSIPTASTPTDRILAELLTTADAIRLRAAANRPGCNAAAKPLMLLAGGKKCQRRPVPNHRELVQHSLESPLTT